MDTLSPEFCAVSQLVLYITESINLLDVFSQDRSTNLMIWAPVPTVRSAMKVSVVSLERIVLSLQCLRLKAQASPLQVILDSFRRAIPNITHFQNIYGILKCAVFRETKIRPRHDLGRDCNHFNSKQVSSPKTPPPSPSSTHRDKTDSCSYASIRSNSHRYPRFRRCRGSIYAMSPPKHYRVRPPLQYA